MASKTRIVYALIALLAAQFNAPSTLYSGEPGPQKPQQADRASTVSQGRVVDRQLRYNRSRNFIEKTYGQVIDGLGIDVVGKQKLLSLLVERVEAIQDVDEIIVANHQSENERRAAQRDATAKADDEIKQMLDPAAQQKLNAMLAAEYELSQIANGYASNMARAGCPLSADQRLQLATALHKTYDFTINPKAGQRGSLPLNEWGLSEVDEHFLKTLEGFLSIEQRGLIRNALVYTNRGASK